LCEKPRNSFLNSYHSRNGFVLIKEGGIVKNNHFQASNFQNYSLEVDREILNRPGRKSNPIPTHPEEEEEPLKPGKEDPAKKKKKKSIYEVTY
jgi:hypothetical protein